MPGFWWLVAESRKPTCILMHTYCKVTNFRKFRIKARGWWPRNRSSTKIFFWRFVFLWVTLALLNPIESFSWRGCVVQATKNKEESCSFLDAIGRRSCGPLSGLAKNRHVGKPKLRLKRIETAGRYATVRFVTLVLSRSPLTCTSTHLRRSLACFSSAHRWACYWKRSSRQPYKFCSISDPPPPSSFSLFLSLSLSLSLFLSLSLSLSLFLSLSLSLSLSFSLRVTRCEKKNHFRWTRQSEHPSESSINVATRSRAPTASM